MCACVLVCVNFVFPLLTGLNGRPVCSVRDDWYVTSSLFPHPLLKGHVLRKAAAPSLAFPLTQSLYGVSSNVNKSGVLTHSDTLITLQT